MIKPIACLGICITLVIGGAALADDSGPLVWAGCGITKKAFMSELATAYKRRYGVDIVLDRDKGPMLLELNARPGISIQNANRLGLRERLRHARELAKEKKDAAGRVELGKQLYRRVDPPAPPVSEPEMVSA